jgi:tRNA-splicing ligase RtcB (3'-phosphate/5'-hydroxy nucleic acid ligase)
MSMGTVGGGVGGRLVELRRVGEYVWEIPKTGGMKVPGRVYLSEAQVRAMANDPALQQVANVAHLPGIVGYSLAMPDIHWGYGFPIGGVAAVDAAEGGVSPGGVGFDVNCGVRLVTTALRREEVKPRIGEVVKALYKAVPTGVGSGAGAGKLGKPELRRVLREGASWAVAHGFVAGDDDPARCEEGGVLAGADPAAVSERALERGSTQLGSLGSGNHFLEVQVVDSLFDEAAAAAFGLSVGQVVVMIHSGSRGLGHQVCDETVASLARKLATFGPDYAALPDRQLACAPIRSEEGRRYLAAMQAAANFAWANRQVMAGLAMDAMAKALGIGRDRLGARLLYDVCHNIAKVETHLIDGEHRRVLVHRKGATRAFGPGDDRVPEPFRAVGQPVLIPGDMARYSFVLAGNAAAMTETFGSSCHGAGRLLSRTQSRKATRGRKLHAELEKAGVTVMSRGYKTLAEEVPEAYKDVADVTAVVEGAGISRRVARLVPIGCIKG